MGNNPSRQQPDKHPHSEKSGYIAHYTPYTPKKTEKTSVGWRPDVKDPTAFADSKLGDAKQRIPAPESKSAPRAQIKSAGELTDAEKESAVVRKLIFWRNGFQVCIPPENGGEEVAGEVIPYDSPEGAYILAEINTGHAPPTLFGVKPGQPICLNIFKHTSEDAPSDITKVSDPPPSSNDSDPASDQRGVPKFAVENYLNQLPIERMPNTEHPVDLPQKIEDLQSISQD